VIATNNGSFPWRGSRRAAEIDAARAGHLRGAAPGAELEALFDQATQRAIEEQARAGLDLLTDGMIRRSDPIGPFIGRLQGMSVGDRLVRLPGDGAECRLPIAETEVAWREPILVEDYLFASRGSPKPVKVVLPGPYTVAFLAEDRAYGDPASLAMALAFAVNQELRALQAAGAAFLQIDEPALLERREDFPIFTRIWEVLGRGITAVLCLHLAGGRLEEIYPGVARLKRLGCLSVDCLAGRASLRLLEEEPVPESLQLGLGIVDGRSEHVEDPEAIATTIAGIRGLPPHDRIHLGTASDLGGLPPEVAAAKLRSLAQAARLLEGGSAARR